MIFRCVKYERILGMHIVELCFDVTTLKWSKWHLKILQLSSQELKDEGIKGRI